MTDALSLTDSTGGPSRRGPGSRRSRSRSGSDRAPEGQSRADCPRPGVLGAVPTALRMYRRKAEPQRSDEPTARLIVVVADQDVFHSDVDLEGDEYDVEVTSAPADLLDLITSDPGPGFDPDGPDDPLRKHLEFSVRLRAGAGVLRARTYNPLPELIPAAALQPSATRSLDVALARCRERLRSLRPPRTRQLMAMFWLLVVAVGAYRLSILLSGGAPATIDSGNWLAFGEQLLGQSGRDSSITYPPLVPVLVTLVTSLVGLQLGVALVGALASLAPGVGMYLGLRRAGLGHIAAGPCLLLLGASSVGEAAAWGGFPQLIGLGLLPITLAVALSHVDAPTRRSAWSLGLLTMASLATSHFMGIVVVVSVAVVFAASILRTRSLRHTVDLIRTSPGLMLPSVWLIPVYLRLIDAVVFHPNEFAALDNLTWSNLIDRLELIYPGFPLLWEVLLPIAIVTPLLCWRARAEAVWRLHSVLTSVILLMVLLTRESRYLYLFPLMGVTGIGVWIAQLGPAVGRSTAVSGVRRRAALVALVAVLIAIQLQSGLGAFREHREFYGVLTPGMIDAIDVADEIGGREGVLAVPSLGDAPIGWWVEALTDGTVYYGSPLRWLNFPDEVERARTANAIFDPSFPSAEATATLRSIGTDVLIVPTRWAWFDEESIRTWVEEHDDVVVAFDHEDVIVLDVRVAG